MRFSSAPSRSGWTRPDRGIAAGQYGEAPPGHDRLIVGHEALGRVEDEGAEAGAPPAAPPAAGSLVVPTVRRSCPEGCRPCRLGQCDFCTTGDFRERGIKGVDGFLAERFIERRDQLVVVPEELADVAVLLEPLSIVVKALDQAFAAQARLPWDPSNALVLGAGPIGLLATLALRLRDLEVTTVARTGPPTPQTERVEELGARYLSSRDRPIDQLAGGGRGWDVIVEATGSSEVAFGAVGELAPNGILVLTSVTPGEARREMPVDEINLGLVLGNRAVVGTVSSNRSHFESGLDMMRSAQARWPGLLARLITRELALDDYAAGLADEPAIKTVVRLGS